MVWKRKVTLILATFGLLGSTAVWAAEPTQQEMMDELRALRSEVKDLRAERQADREKMSARDVDATVNSIVSDAHHRSQLFAAEVALPTAGYNNGLFIQSENGDFSLKPGVIIQIRNVTAWREDAKNGNTENDIQHGWEVRRAKLSLAGNVFGKDITYKFQIANDRNAGPIVLDDAWIAYQVHKQWNIRVGQFKAPFSHEEFGVGDTDQLAVERSLVNDLLGENAFGSRVQGINAIWKSEDDKLHTEAMLHDGDNSINTDYRDNAPTTTTGGNVTIPGTPPIVVGGPTTSSDTRARIGATGRVEYILSGHWNQYKDFSARNNKTDLAVLGSGVNWSQSPASDVYRATVDLQWENTTGWSAYGAVFGVYTDKLSGAIGERLDYGALIQAGYMLNPKWEVFGRADVSIFDEDFVTSDEIVSEYTVGVNRFLGKDGSAGHRAQISFDITYLPVSVPSDKTGLGYQANGGRNEIVARLQFQLQI